MKTLTVFTPTYNRKHTLPRTYESLCRQTCKDFDWLVIDDGSGDGTREWIESLGVKMIAAGQAFDWMGRVLSEELGVRSSQPLERLDKPWREDEALAEGSKSEEFTSYDHFFIKTPNLRIEYVYKPNGGLYTGYNVAYQTIQTELCVCIDSDDYMPDDAVEKILTLWKKKGGNRYCGIVGLDFDVRTKEPIGGFFKESTDEIWALEMNHVGDTKYVFHTELMREVAPQIGFEGERDFNPHYMQMQVLDKWQILLMNENLCWVEYQIGGDSMSQGIFRQYVRSPRSYAKYRLMELSITHGMSLKRKMMLHIHFVSSCIMSGEMSMLKKSPNWLMSLLALPLSIVEIFYIKMKMQ